MSKGGGTQHFQAWAEKAQTYLHTNCDGLRFALEKLEISKEQIDDHIADFKGFSDNCKIVEKLNQFLLASTNSAEVTYAESAQEHSLAFCRLLILSRSIRWLLAVCSSCSEAFVGFLPFAHFVQEHSLASCRLLILFRSICWLIAVCSCWLRNIRWLLAFALYTPLLHRHDQRDAGCPAFCRCSGCPDIVSRVCVV